MMKKQRSKEMGGDEPQVKQKDAEQTVSSEVQNPTVSKSVQAQSDGQMHGVGVFKSGEIITDPEKIAIIGDNPNFKEVKTGGTL